MQVWHNDKVVRSIGFRNVGLVGILHMEIAPGKELAQGLGRDLIGMACNDIDGVPEDHAHSMLAFVDNDRLEISLPVIG